MDSKPELRTRMREERKEHSAAIPDSVRALLFKRPPEPLLALVPSGATVGLYHAQDAEAPTASYARYFAEAGYRIALPRLVAGEAFMEFAEHTDPFSQSDLVSGPLGISQPGADAEPVVPQIVFVPLLAFTETGIRLGQGGGFYDRWLAQNPGTVAIGMGWDCQKLALIPAAPHDIAMQAIVTPTRLYGPF